HGVGILKEVVGRRRRVQPSLGIKDIQAPRLVEADADPVGGGAEGAPARPREPPGAEESWDGRQPDGGVVQVRRQGLSVTGASVQVALMAIRTETPGQGRDVGLAAAAGRQNVLVTECDVHGLSTRSVGVGLPCPLAWRARTAGPGRLYAASHVK